MKTKEKRSYSKGSWVTTLRCMNCNDLDLLEKLGEDRKKYENKGMVLDDGKEIPCVMMCDNGWFHQTGTISS